MKAVKNFRRLVDPHKAGTTLQSILGGDIEPNFVEPPMEIDSNDDFPEVGLDPNVKRSSVGHIRKILERHPALADDRGLSDSSQSANSSKRPSGVFEPEEKDSGSVRSGRSPGKTDFDASHHSQSASPIPLSRASSGMTKRSAEGTRGHARDPLECEFPYLFIGPSTYTGTSSLEKNSDSNLDSDSVALTEEPESAFEDGTEYPADDNVQMVSESPGAADFDIYETAYRSELERINSHSVEKEVTPRVYLTRRVQNRDEMLQFVKDKAINLQTDAMAKLKSPASKGSAAFGAAVSLLRNQMEQKKATEEKDEQQAQKEEQGRTDSTNEAQLSKFRESNLPLSSISSQSIPGPEASSLEATGVSASEPRQRKDSAAKLRQLLENAGHKGGE